MPHITVKLIPGVDTNKTPTLNEAAISYTDLVRFMPDRSGYGLVQKLGGWTRYISGSFSAPIRALLGWSDLEYTKYLAIGGEGTVGAQVYNQGDGSLTDVTPNILTQDITVGTTYGITTQSASSSVTLYMPLIPSAASYVYFPTIVNVGNVNLVGPYDIVTVGSGFLTFVVPNIQTYIAKISAVPAGADRTVTILFQSETYFKVGQVVYVSGVSDLTPPATTFNGSFTITSVTANSITYTQTGNANAATSYGGSVVPVVTLGGLPPKFNTTASSNTVVVDLVAHGFFVGDTFNVPVPTTVGGATISGLYTVAKASIPDQFEIVLSLPATSTANGYENAGNLRVESFVSIVGADQGANYVYGGGVYNEGLYGSGYVPSASLGNPITATDWSFDNWGSILVGNPKNGAIYYWQPVGGSVQNLSYMPNAPVYNTGAFVSMPQRQVIAYGSSFGTIQDPLLVRWCDLEDFTVWFGTANNQAGSYRIPTGSRLVGGFQAAQQTLLWTDLDLWSMTYIGQPYIYGFNKIGANAGLIAQKAASQMGGVVYWMSQKQFFKFSGNGVEVIQCPIWDQVFQNFYPGNDENGNPYTDRIRCASNSQFNEITWHFPAHYTNDIDPATGIALAALQIGTGEVNAYVKYNVALNQWDYGYQHPDDPGVLVGRTAWIDQSVLGPPIGVGATSSVNVSNGIPIDGYFIGACLYASGGSSVATLYYNPIDRAFVYGTSIIVSGFSNTSFNGEFTVTSSAVGKSSVVTISFASPGVVTWINHGLIANEPVYFTSSQTMPTGLTANTVYFVKTVLDANTFTVSSAVGGAAINTSSTGAGSISAYLPSKVVMGNAAFAATNGSETSAGTVGYVVNAYIYQHETSNNADGAAMDSGFTTGYSALSEGDQMMFIDQVWPDMKWGFVDEEKSAEVKITFYVTNYPGDEPIQYGPYTVTQGTQYLSVRMRGRLISMSVSSTDTDSFWRIGAIRYRFQPDGKY